MSAKNYGNQLMYVRVISRDKGGTFMMQCDVCTVQKKDELKSQIEQFLADEPTNSQAADTATDVTNTEQDVSVTENSA